VTRILSGMQPTNQLHLGNYLGALKNWVALQDVGENLFCVVDLHAITLPQDPAVLAQSTREIAAAYIAAGIDTGKSIIFAQSHVSAHAELAWILGCLTPMGWLNRMTQFKDKAGKDKTF
jgi:tryptophanyl-tRNA synthetase